jgi:DNA-binding beta-propeller fold protein YncE
VAVDARRGRALVTNGDGHSVSVLDVRSGALLQTIGVSVNPVDVAVDEHASQAFVLTYGGTVAEAAGWWTPWTWWLRSWLPWLPQQPPLRTLSGTVTILDLSHL